MSNIDRKLTTIRQITEIKPISNADSIELAVVDGWQCVVKKGQFKVEDYIIYFEIDSMLPEGDARFDFLKTRRNIFGISRPVIKTIKLRGQISQGLVMPLTDFPEIFWRPTGLTRIWRMLGLGDRFLEIHSLPQVLKENLDLDSLLGVEKYDSEIDYSPPKEIRHKSKFAKWKYKFSQLFAGKKLAKKKGKSTFPSYIPRTDEPRVQNMYHSLVNSKSDPEYEVTVKMDGSSSTFWYYDEKFQFASRNVLLSKGMAPATFLHVIDKYKLDENLPAFCNSISRRLAFQGELVAPSIQSNYENVKEPDFFLFKIFDIDAQKLLLPKERMEMFNKYNEFVTETQRIKHVPIKGIRKLSEYSSLEGLLKSADGVPSVNIKEAEGTVWQRVDKDESFKIISNQYLLKKK